EATSVIQSERAQLVLARRLRELLDPYLSSAGARDALAYEAVLAVKGAVFARQKHLRDARRFFAQAGDAEAVRLYRELEDATRHLATLALSLPAPGEAEDWKSSIADLTKRKEALEEDLSRRSAAYPEQKARAAVTGSAGRAALRAGAVLLDFLEYDRTAPAAGNGRPKEERSLLVFVVRRDRAAASVDLGPAAPVREAVERWRLGVRPGPARAQ